MIVYQTNHSGVYVGPVEADESPLEPGIFLIPGGAVETPPPEIPSGHVAVWINQAWEVVPLPAVVEDEMSGEVVIDPKMVGVEFEGVMCSATEKDQNGLAAVLMAIQLKGSQFKPTRFYFENGNTLIITLANYQAFADVWVSFRQSFFEVEEI